MTLYNLSKLYTKYGKKTAGMLSLDDQHILKQGLESINNIDNKTDAKKFLELLSLLREAETRSIEGLGPEALSTIIGAFAGGDEGVYSADTDLMNARFIFELVQNVDDCQYQSPDDCKLIIKFNVRDDKIVLEYNELGFMPVNVMAITGLGNSTKNHKKARNRKAEESLDQGDLLEIGEKGIGFKSIFGLAKTVKITSQYFCFSIDRDSFFVPIVEDYTDFSYQNKTTLELTLDPGMVKELYRFLKIKYDNTEAIINENPILFLNRLTEIQYYVSEKENFGFKVSRRDENEDYSQVDTIIEYYSSNKKNRSIEAIRFSHNIEYSIEECKSRYGENEDNTRKHKIIVIAPKNPELIKKGRVYSFFATAEIINAPFIIHAPFRLNSGRTKIVTQSQGANSTNAWFVKTLNETIRMVHFVYERISRLFREKIRFFIPDNCLMNYGSALYCPEFRKSSITRWNIFETVNGNYVSAQNVCCIDYNAKIEDIIEIHGVLKLTKPLLNISFDLIPAFSEFGIVRVTNVKQRLFVKALRDETSVEVCCKYLNDYIPSDDLEGIDRTRLALSKKQVIELSKHERLTKWVNRHTLAFLSGRQDWAVSTTCTDRSWDIETIRAFSTDHIDIINKVFFNYIKEVRYIRVDGIKNAVFTQNGVFGNNALEDFAELYHELNPKDKFFYPFLRIEAVSKDIDNLCMDGENYSDYVFLKVLQNFRRIQKNTLKEQYKSILELIERSGVNQDRFFQEILQNIDDCSFEEPAHAVIRFQKVRDDYQIIAEYNEIGFTREQVRAITAIGSSTKRMLMSSLKTGEKGVGFKSVFAICKSVSIESGKFKFKLTSDQPTVPNDLKEIEKKGTRMVYTLKPGFASQVKELFNDEAKILRSCICLKTLHSLFINGRRISITEDDNSRTFSYETRKYKFYKYVHTFIVNNQLALYERRKTKDVSSSQKITYLMSAVSEVPCRGIYSTFQTLERVDIPMLIDMPLHLDTARERMLDNEWNKAIVNHMIEGFEYAYQSLLPHCGKSISFYLPKKDENILPERYGVVGQLIERVPFWSIFKKAYSNDYCSLNKGIFSKTIEYYCFEKHRKLLSDLIPENLLAEDLELLDLIKQWNIPNRHRTAFSSISIQIPRYVHLRSEEEICITINTLLERSREAFDNTIQDSRFRSLLYDYLGEAVKSNYIMSIIRTWRIIPIKYQKQTYFVDYSENIYSPPTKQRNQAIDSEKYRILDVKTMSVETFNKIYGRVNGSIRYIQEFSQDIIISDFYKNIENVLLLPDEKRRAKELLKIFNTEKALFKETIKTRKDFPYGRVRLISRTENALSFDRSFLCKSKDSQGCLDRIIVADDYKELAKELGAVGIEKIDSYKQISFVIHREELHDLIRNKFIEKRLQLFTSLYMSNEKAEDLSDGIGFFELYSVSDHAKRLETSQSKKVISIDDAVIKRYSKYINEISLSNAPIAFSVKFKLEEFDKSNLLSEIEDELQIRRATTNINRILELLMGTYYGDIKRREPCVIRCKNNSILVIDSKISAEYDILEVLKGFFLQYFNTEISINRNIHIYTRRGFENISRIETTEEEVSDAAKQLYAVDLSNVEDIKDMVCRPITLRGVTYGGYAKTCPLCGCRIDTELTGMRVYKTKCNGVMIPLISCSNCHENLRYASQIDIDTEKLKAGRLSMKCIVNGMDWKINDMVLRLGHRVLINRLNMKE